MQRVYKYDHRTTFLEMRFEVCDPVSGTLPMKWLLKSAPMVRVAKRHAEYGNACPYRNNGAQSSIGSAAKAGHMISRRDYDRSKGAFPHHPLQFPRCVSPHVPC